MDDAALAETFQAHRVHLRAIAYRMLGSPGEADDAVQEAWLRLNRSDAREIDNLGGWLTTVVARISLDMLRARRSRREDPHEEVAAVGAATSGGPEDEAVLADAVGAALLVVLDTLQPVERLAFVLHDMFGVPFDEIATIVDRSSGAAKQLASRARRKVRGAGPAGETDPLRQRAVVDAFLAASRSGDFDALVALLAPEIVLAADDAAVRMGSAPEVRGADAVAQVFSGRALAAQPALLGTAVGIAWAVNGATRVAWDVAIRDGAIVRIDMLAEREVLDDLDVVLLADR